MIDVISVIAHNEKVKHKRLIREACAHFEFKWPEQLTSGVMLFQGETIDIEEFMEYCQLYNQATSR